MASPKLSPRDWGTPPWNIAFAPPPRDLPREADFVIVGAGFTGLAAAAWLRLLEPAKSVVVLEAGRVGNGASGRTGGMALAETAAGNLPGLGDVLAGVQGILARLEIDCDLLLPGAWEIGRSGGTGDSPIRWNDSGTLRVVGEVPGGTLDPGKLVSGLARASQERGAVILENHRLLKLRWNARPVLAVAQGSSAEQTGEITAGKILFATSALSLPLSGLVVGMHPKLTLAARTAPLNNDRLHSLGLAGGKPFYTVDLPYLWGRTCPDNSIVWGAGLLDPPPSGNLEELSAASPEVRKMFANFEKRVRRLHPASADLQFTHFWGGPILFRDNWNGEPVFDWHPQARHKQALVIGAFAGHGVALSNYLGAWAAEVLLSRRELPSWGKFW